MLPLIFILGGSFGCSIGTDKSGPLDEKPLNQNQFNVEGSSFKSQSKIPSAKVISAERSEMEADDHPQVDNKQKIAREIVVPSEVEGKWEAVKILIQNKKYRKRVEIKVAELGTSFIHGDSGLKVTVGPFLPNFTMNKTTYTSIGNGNLNPAVQLIVEENGKIIYKGWTFMKFPSMYAFEHQVFSIKLIEAIPTAAS